MKKLVRLLKTLRRELNGEGWVIMRRIILGASDGGWILDKIILIIHFKPKYRSVLCQVIDKQPCCLSSIGRWALPLGRTQYDDHACALERSAGMMADTAHQRRAWPEVARRCRERMRAWVSTARSMKWRPLFDDTQQHGRDLCVIINSCSDIIYNFIHHQIIIANNEKNKQIEMINIYATLTNCVQKTLLHNLYFLAKTSLFSR